MTSLYHGSDVVSQEQNTPGVKTPILTVEPEDGTKIEFLNRVSVGSAAGLPIYAKLRDSNGDPLPVGTSMVLTARKAGEDDYSNVSEVVGDIRAYNNQDISDQQNSENVDSVKVELNGELVSIRDIDDFRVELDSSVQIDWDQSEFYFDRRAVNETQKED